MKKEEEKDNKSLWGPESSSVSNKEENQINSSWGAPTEEHQPPVNKSFEKMEPASQK